MSMGFQLYTNRQKNNTGRKVLLLMFFLGITITAFYYLNRQIQEFYIERELMSVVAQVVIPEIKIPDEEIAIINNLAMGGSLAEGESRAMRRDMEESGYKPIVEEAPMVSEQQV